MSIATINAILIDPFNAVIRPVSFDRGSLPAIYTLLDCDLIDIVRLSIGLELVIDDEGLLRADGATFEIDGRVIYGKALLVGPADSEGNMTSVDMRLAGAMTIGFEPARIEARRKAVGPSNDNTPRHLTTNRS